MNPMSQLRSRRAPISLAVLLLLVLGLGMGTPALAKKKKKGKDPEAVINGRVMNQAEEVLRDVQVVVRSQAGEFETTASTDKKGEFEIHVPEPDGNYLVHLAKEGFADFEAEILLTENEIQNIDFKLLDASVGRQQDAISAYNEGATAYSAGNMAEAKAGFLEASELNPELPEPYLGLADIYLDEGAAAEAAAAVERYLALRPGEERALRLAFDAYRALGDEAKVAELQAQLAETGMASGLAVTVFNEGAHATQAGDLEKAITKFREALRLDPELVQAHAALATVFYNLERYDEALEAANAVIEIDPSHLQGLRMRFLVHDAQNDQTAVLASFEAYSEVDPEGAADVLYQRADLDFRDGQTDRAQAALLKVLELFPDMARAHYTLGLTYASSDTAKARKHLERFIELAPDDPEVAAAKEMMSYF